MNLRASLTFPIPEVSCKGRLAELDDKISTIERKLDFLEALVWFALFFCFINVLQRSRGQTLQ